MSAGKTIDKPNLIKWLISFLVPLGIYFTPTSDLYTEQIRLFLVITVLGILVIAFEFFDYLIPSILLPAAYIGAGIAPMNVVFSGWTSTLPMMLLGAFLLANVLDEVGLLKRIAYWCILKTGGSFKGIVFGIAIAGILLSILTSCRSYMIMATMCYGICSALKLGVSKESAVIMLTGAVSSVTTMLFVYTPSVIALSITGGKTVDPNFTIGWGQFMFNNLPQLAFVLLFVWLLTKLYKPSKEINGKTYFQEETDKLGKVTIAEKKAGLITLVLMAFLMTGGLHGIDVAWGFIVIPCLFYFPGIQVGTSKSIKNLNFTMIFFIAACLAIGNVSKAIGIGDIVSSVLAPILAPHNALVALIVIWIFGTLANILMTPMALLAAFAGPIASIANTLGINPMGAINTLIYTIDQVFMPYESAPYLVFFTFGIFTMKDFLKIMSLKVILQFICLVVIFIPYWYLIGIL